LARANIFPSERERQAIVRALPTTGNDRHSSLPRKKCASGLRLRTAIPVGGMRESTSTPNNLSRAHQCAVAPGETQPVRQKRKAGITTRSRHQPETKRVDRHRCSFLISRQNLPVVERNLPVVESLASDRHRSLPRTQSPPRVEQKHKLKIHSRKSSHTNFRTLKGLEIVPSRNRRTMNSPRLAQPT
jgi:hypothetical protein